MGSLIIDGERRGRVSFSIGVPLGSPAWNWAAEPFDGSRRSGCEMTKEAAKEAVERAIREGGPKPPPPPPQPPRYLAFTKPRRGPVRMKRDARPDHP